jgi:hypothetical protein
MCRRTVRAAAAICAVFAAPPSTDAGSAKTAEIAVEENWTRCGAVAGVRAGAGVGADIGAGVGADAGAAAGVGFGAARGEASERGAPLLAVAAPSAARGDELPTSMGGRAVAGRDAGASTGAGASTSVAEDAFNGVANDASDGIARSLPGAP